MTHFNIILILFLRIESQRKNYETWLRRDAIFSRYPFSVIAEALAVVAETLAVELELALALGSASIVGLKVALRP